MYIPEYNRIEDRSVALAFMRANPFAILVSPTDSDPFATHLPLLVHQIDGQLGLRGHVAKANPHWKFLEQGGESLIIFHGPHAYISPVLYENHESVPTWNYAAVHAYGAAKLITAESDLQLLLQELIALFDQAYLEQWSSLSDDYRLRMIRHIVGFEIQVTRIETKFKLSQNRTRADQESVIWALEQNPHSAATEVARLMRQQGLGLK
jgi:transcriptional regulator